MRNDGRFRPGWSEGCAEREVVELGLRIAQEVSDVTEGPGCAFKRLYACERWAPDSPRREMHCRVSLNVSTEPASADLLE
jgi:hypothetical protein